MRTKTAQLDREIAEALARKPGRHHATVRARAHSQYPGAEDWDVASDALLAGDASRAAQVVRALHKEPGRAREAGTPVFEEAIGEIAPTLREEFFRQLGVRTAHRHVDAINEAIKGTNPDTLIAAVSAAKKHKAAIKRLGFTGGADSSGVYDPASYELGNLLVKAEEMVRRIKIERKTGRMPKPSRHTAWKLA